MICDLLHFYHKETKEYVDVSDIRLDLEAIDIEDNLIKQLDDICEDEPVEEIAEPIVLTEEEKIRQLESTYKELSKTAENSQKRLMHIWNGIKRQYYILAASIQRRTAILRSLRI